MGFLSLRCVIRVYELGSPVEIKAADCNGDITVDVFASYGKSARACACRFLFD